jgi:predicted double-glycine peptidase
MAFASGDGAYQYDDKAVREDLLSVLTNLSPTETQLVSGLGTGSASSVLHEWLTDTLGSVKTNAAAEGADFTYPTLTSPTRLFNYTQIFSQPYQVSGTERAVNTAAFNDRFSYEATKAMKMIKNDMEYAVLRGSLSCGTGSAARRLQGIKNFLSLVTSQSGTSLTDSILNDLLQLQWDNGSETNAIYGGMYIKRKISGFTAGATKNVEATDRRLVNSVDVYEADAAKLVKLFAHRYMTVSGDTNYDVMGLDEDKFRIAYLRKPTTVDLAKTGDSDKGAILTEMTVECLHPHAGFLCTQML